jgi:membrane-bound metal-dependent hydrolase YbcI (DUF457 family)
MEGTTHAVTGFLAGIGIGLFAHVGVPHQQVAEALGQDALFGLVAAGMSLLPDADHPDATFAHSAGALSHGISHLVAVMFGGHRQGMHSVFGVIVTSLATAACTLWWPNRWALGFFAAFLAICVVAGMKATGFMRHGAAGRGRRGHRYHGGLDRAVAGCGVAALAVFYIRADLWWLVALGMALHILEDLCTGHGTALLWPLTRQRFGGDGHQPAAEPRSTPARKPAQRRPAARRPAPRPRPVGSPAPAWPVPGFEPPPEPASPPAPEPAARPRARPYQPSRTFWPAICPECLDGDCPDCRDKDCRCNRRVPHAARPGNSVASEVVPQPAASRDDPDDIPPF